jgi:hypothetical protein
MRDLQLNQHKLKYLSVDKEMAYVVISMFKNHRWYLTEEITYVTIDSDQVIAAGIKLIPEKFGRRKPMFQQISPDTSPASLVGPDSYTLFHAFHINTDWLANQ